MKRVATLVLMIGSLCGSALCQYCAEFSSYHSGNRYDFRITPERLSNTPAWLEGQPNPPLSARRAKDIAAGYLSTLFNDANEWSIGGIELVPVRDRWVYSIEFTEPRQSGCYDCLTTPFRVVVLMDGVAVAAAVSPWKRETSTH